MADLAAFRAYGALFADDREGGLNAIRAEARRMQERVTFEKEIRLAMQQKETEERDPDDPEEDVEDPDEWWRLLQDGGEQERYVPESILSQNYTPLQANRLMHAFMPTTGQPQELGHLLSCAIHNQRRRQEVPYFPADRRERGDPEVSAGAAWRSSRGLGQNLTKTI